MGLNCHRHLLDVSKTVSGGLRKNLRVFWKIFWKGALFNDFYWGIFFLMVAVAAGKVIIRTKPLFFLHGKVPTDGTDKLPILINFKFTNHFRSLYTYTAWKSLPAQGH